MSRMDVGAYEGVKFALYAGRIENLYLHGCVTAEVDGYHCDCPLVIATWSMRMRGPVNEEVRPVHLNSQDGHELFDFGFRTGWNPAFFFAPPAGRLTAAMPDENYETFPFSVAFHAWMKDQVRQHAAALADAVFRQFKGEDHE